MIQAEPATRGEAWARKSKLNEAETAKIIEQMPEDGYRVRYPDGYESWSPKEVFEKAYLELTVNSGLKTTGASISQEMVDAFISSYEVCTMGNKCTVVRAILRNGFESVVIDNRARRVAFEGLTPIGPEGIERSLVHRKFMTRQDTNRIGRIPGALAVRIEHANRFDFVIK